MSRMSHAVLACALLMLSGCTGVPVGGGGGGGAGGGALSVTAGGVTVTEEAREAGGFSVVSDEPVSFERSFEVAGQSKGVEARADMIHLQRAGATPATTTRVVVLSVPVVEVLGQQISIARRIGPLSLIERAGSAAGDIQRGQKVRTHTIGILGSARTVAVYRGTANESGSEARVLILATTFSHGGDTVVAIGLVPRTSENGERAVLLAFEGIERESGTPAE